MKKLFANHFLFILVLVIPGFSGNISVIDSVNWTFTATSPGDHPALPPNQLLVKMGKFTGLRHAGFAGWHPDGGMYIVTTFNEIPQLHQVLFPVGARTQLTFLSRRMAHLEMNPQLKPEFLYLADNDGDEKYSLWKYDIQNAQSIRLSSDSCRIPGISWSQNGRFLALAANCSSQGSWEIRAGPLHKPNMFRFKPTGTWFPLGWNDNGNSLLIMQYVSSTKSNLFKLNPGTQKAVPVLPNLDGYIGTAFYSNGKEKIADIVYFLSDHNGEFTHLYRWDGRDVKDLTPGFKWNVEWVEPAPKGESLLFSINKGGFSELFLFDLQSDSIVYLPVKPKGMIFQAKFSPDGKKIGFTKQNPVHPMEAFSYDLDSKNSTRWTFSEKAGLDEKKFIHPRLIHYPTFDSVAGEKRKIPAFIFPSPYKKPAPVLIKLHGGPESQARPGFDPFVQHLVSMGITVIIPNIRGSSGYGKTWLKLDDQTFRGDAIRDIEALLDWIQTQPGLNHEKVMVMGRSYGGFLALACATQFGERISGAISTAGIADFQSFLKNTSPYRRDLRRVEYGDERDPKFISFFNKISPLKHVDNIKTPLFLIHGKKDPRVPFSESVAIFNAMKKSGTPSWYLEFKNEGHVIRKKENQVIQNAWKVQFIRQFLL